MSPSSFPRQLVLAALAAALWPAAWLVLAPVLGGPGALAAHLLVTGACHVGALAAAAGRRPLPTFGLVLGLGGAVLVLAPGSREGLLALAGVVGACRALVSGSGGSPARVLLREGALLGLGLLLARSVAGPGIAGQCLAIWAFGLVQSAWVLVAGPHPGVRRGAAGVDPFERSRAALRTIVEAGAGRGGGAR